MANELHFPLFHGYVDRWLVSGVTETPVITKPTALHGAENEKLNTAPKDKPGEEQFKAERRAKEGKRDNGQNNQQQSGSGLNMGGMGGLGGITGNMF